MLANIITVTRTLLTFCVIAPFGHHSTLDIALIFTIAIIFTLDAVDGYIARRRNETTATGALLDTIADRIIENTFWIYFTAIGLLPLWMPITVMARGVITDTLQQKHEYPTHGWTHALTRSRISRGLYGIVKMLTFITLASTTIFDNPVLRSLSFLLAILTVVSCLIRGMPVVGAFYKPIFLIQKTQKR